MNPGAGGVAPYTVASGGNLVDNSPSRLNVAKAGLTSIINTYMTSVDFALADYQTSGLTLFNTWVYHMSPPGGFVFTSLPGASKYVANPCYNYNPAGADRVNQDCVAIDRNYAAQTIKLQPYMLVSATSDDPSINDVLYAGGGIDPVCVVNGTINPPTPFPPNYTLANYNTGGVLVGYSNQVNNCARVTGPTNAGFVPYSTEVMYAQRGFGYYTFGETSGSGNILVNMTSAGAVPTSASTSAAIARFTPLLAPETNNSGTTEIKAAGTQSPTAGLLTGVRTYYATNPPSSNGCVATKYVVLVTDGLPTMDLRGLIWPPLGSAAASAPPNGYGVTATFNADGSLNTTNSQALTDTITVLTALNASGIRTYVIGVGAGVDPAQNPVAAQTLTAMAIAGGTGAYFPAISPVALTNDLQVILAKILSQTQSTSSAAVNSTGLRTGSVVYQSQFITSDASQDWTGELYAFPIDPNTGLVNTAKSAAVWSAATQLDLENWDTGRLIATWDPTSSAGTPFRWNAALAPHGISATTALGTALSTFAADTNGQDILQFIRGSNARELRFGGQLRNRTHKLGDIVDSNPLYIGQSTGPSQDPTYFTFAASTATRPPILYVGANDGMLHAFDAITGAERFAYVPNGVWNNLVNLASPYYNQQHLFYVNGSPQATDVKFSDATWHTVLVGNEGAGGKTLFALDVTDPASINSEAALASKVLWEFSDTNMGLSFSEPAIANTNAGWAVFFGNGYNSSTGTPFLYAINPQTGATIAKIDLCGQVAGVCNAAAANGLSSVTVVNSGGQFAQAANILYAGDLQGNLWRVNISAVSPASWTVTVVLQATDASGVRQPITTAPAVSLNPRFPNVLGTMVSVATGSLLSFTDLSNTQLQTIYGVYDPPASYATPLHRSDLVQQTLANATLGGTAVRTITNNGVSVPTNKGWFIDLSLLSGERVVTDPRMESGGVLVLTSYQPNTSSCTGGGNAFLTMVNYANGGSFPLPQFDASGDGKITSADTMTSPPAGTGANPVGLSLGSVYAAAPTIRSANFSTASAVKLITESSGAIKTVIERGATKARTAWWEIR